VYLTKLSAWGSGIKAGVLGLPYNGIHLSELLDVATNNVSRDDSSNKFDHTVGNTADAVDGDHSIRVILAVVRELILGVVAAVRRGYQSASGSSINDQEDGGKNTKDKDGARENVLGGKSLDQRGDQDGANTLEGLVETGEETEALEGPGGSLLQDSFVVIAVRGQGNNGAVESLKAELIDHDAGDVEGDVAALGRRERLEALLQLSDPLRHCCGSSRTRLCGTKGS
jgi:hypothetical protein